MEGGNKLRLILLSDAAKIIKTRVRVVANWVKRGKIKSHRVPGEPHSVYVDLNAVKAHRAISRSRGLIKEPRDPRDTTRCNWCQERPINKSLPVSRITGEKRYLCKTCWREDEAAEPKESRAKYCKTKAYRFARNEEEREKARQGAK